MLVNLYRINGPKKKNNKPSTTTRRSFSRENLEKCRTELAVMDWREELAEKEDVNIAYSLFINKFLRFFDSNIHKNTIRFNDRTMQINQHMSKGLMRSRLKKKTIKFIKE